MKIKTTRYIILVIFLVSVAFRFFLCAKGGQFFYIDEARFMNGHYLLAHISDCDWTSAIKRITSTYAHTLFIFISAIIEGFRYIYVLVFVDSNAPAFLLADSRIAIEVAAFLLSFASALNILLLYFVVKKSGGTNLQAIIASILLASATSNFYFSRHLLPYDTSITFALIALCFALNRSNSKYNSVLTGLFCGLTTLTYNGYWTISALVWVILIIRSGDRLTKKFEHGIISLLSGISPIILLHVISLLYGGNYLTGMQDWLIATKANQYGDIGIGWKVLISYLWDSEGIVSIIYFISVLSAIYFFFKYRKLELNYKDIGFFSILFIIFTLLFLCDFLKSSVLYGRTIKQITPFFCIALSFPVSVFIENLKSPKQRIFVLVLVLFFGFQILFNFNKCLNLEFPENFISNSNSQQKEYSNMADLTGPNITNTDFNSSLSSFAVINAQTFVPPFTGYRSIPIKEVLLESDHPYNFKPYQYIHYNEQERNQLRQLQLKMKFVELIK